MQRWVPMRDGVMLRADVYRPAGIDEPLPVLLTRHPYGKNAHMPERAYSDPVRLAQAGYIVVIQDVRGRFASGGEFNLGFQEIEDGYDAVQWASQLPGSNGVVGMYGRSYHAETQWAAARNRPPALKSIVPGLSLAEQQGRAPQPYAAERVGLPTGVHLGPGPR